MPSLRHQRVRELLKRTVGDILRREFSTDECGLVSINDVGMANDLKSATIFISVLGSDEQKATAARQLVKHRSHIQFQLGRDVILKYTPKIKLVVHDSIEQGNRVLSILDELKQEEQS